MGRYINRGEAAFRQYTNGEYVDKTAMIAYINSTIDTADKLTCVSRPRRFGKSMAAQMLYAYYDKSCDSRELFAKYKIAEEATFAKHLNKYPAIYIDVTRFTTKYSGRDDIVKVMQEDIIKGSTRFRVGMSFIGRRRCGIPAAHGSCMHTVSQRCFCPARKPDLLQLPTQILL